MRITNVFLEAVATQNFCPKKVRSDCGTENVIIAADQASLLIHRRRMCMELRNITKGYSFGYPGGHFFAEARAHGG